MKTMMRLEFCDPRLRGRLVYIYEEDWYIFTNSCLDLFKHCELGVIFLYPHEAR